MSYSHPLPPGLYDTLVDRHLDALINALDADLLGDVESCDPAEASDRLSRLFAEALRSALESVSKTEQKAALIGRLRQVLAARTAASSTTANWSSPIPRTPKPHPVFSRSAHASAASPPPNPPNALAPPSPPVRSS